MEKFLNLIVISFWHLEIFNISIFKQTGDSHTAFPKNQKMLKRSTDHSIWIHCCHAYWCFPDQGNKNETNFQNFQSKSQSFLPIRKTRMQLTAKVHWIFQDVLSITMYTNNMLGITLLRLFVFASLQLFYICSNSFGSSWNEIGWQVKKW